MLRALADQQPKLSVPTDAELSAVDTGSLLSGDFAFTEETGRFVYLRNSSIAASPHVVLNTWNSDGGTLPGRWIWDGFSPTGPTLTIPFAEDILDEDTTIVADAPPVTILTVNITTTADNQNVLALFTYSGVGGNEIDTNTIFDAFFQLDAVDQDPGVTESSTTNSNYISGALHRVFTIPTAGAHTITVQAESTGGDFNIIAASNTAVNAVLTVINLG